jgi:hypothetical protein
LETATLLAETRRTGEILVDLLSAFRDLPVPVPTLDVGSDSTGVAGATWTPGRCTDLSLPRGHAWTATWGAEAITRSDPAAAVEAARRRACVGGYIAGAHQAFAAIGNAAPEVKATLLRGALDEGQQGLERCVAGKPAFAAAAEPPPPAPRFRAYTCRVAFGADDAGGQGWGTTLDEAAEAALRADVRQAAWSLAAAVRKIGSADPAQMAIVLSRAASDWLAPVPGDRTERASLTCAGLGAAEGRVTWQPTEPCPVSALRDAEGKWDEAAARLCDPVLAEVAPPKAEGPADRLALARWGGAAACARQCVTRAAPVPAGIPVLVPGVPDRSTREAARAVAEAAVRDRDLELATLVFPTLTDQRFQARLMADPDAGWAAIAALLADPDAQWQQIGPTWVLVPPPRAGMGRAPPR